MRLRKFAWSRYDLKPADTARRKQEVRMEEKSEPRAAVFAVSRVGVMPFRPA